MVGPTSRSITATTDSSPATARSLTRSDDESSKRFDTERRVCQNTTPSPMKNRTLGIEISLQDLPHHNHETLDFFILSDEMF